jgi:hypothetical protein
MKTLILLTRGVSENEFNFWNKDSYYTIFEIDNVGTPLILQKKYKKYQLFIVRTMTYIQSGIWGINKLTRNIWSWTLNSKQYKLLYHNIGNDFKLNKFVHKYEYSELEPKKEIVKYINIKNPSSNKEILNKLRNSIISGKNEELALEKVWKFFEIKENKSLKKDIMLTFLLCCMSQETIRANSKITNDLSVFPDKMRPLIKKQIDIMEKNVYSDLKYQSAFMELCKILNEIT